MNHEEYRKAVDDIARATLAACGDNDERWRDFVREQVKWSSWVLSASRARELTGGRGSAASIMENDVVEHCHEKAREYLPSQWRLRFKEAARWVTFCDMDPLTDSEAWLVFSSVASAIEGREQLRRSFERQFLEFPLVELVGINLLGEEVDVKD